jgi:branched-chain amino acid transport system substrate-binding protein
VAGLIANIGAEVRIAPKMSFDVIGHYSPYDYFKYDRKIRVFAIQPELRYWFGNPLVKGHFVGLHVPVTGFNVQLGDAQAAGADLLFLPIYYTPASQILTQADKMGYKPTVFGVDGMDGILGVEGFDTALAEGVYLLTPFVANAEDELTKTFVENYKARANGEVPNQFAADAYDCIYALAQACENAGITSDMSNADICAAMVEQFTTMTFNGLTGSDMTWNENGEVTKAPKAMIIENGEYVPAAE